MKVSWHYIEDHYTGEIKIYCDISSANMACDPTKHYSPKPVIEHIGESQ